MTKKALSTILSLCFFSLLSTNAQLSNGSFMHDGVTRTYNVYIPSSYNANTPVPLVINYHGFTGSGAQHAIASNFGPIADTANFIVVHPTGTPLPPIGLNHWNVGAWTTTSTADDLGFTSALIDTIAANYNINLMRVYACGFSNGGFFSHKLACELGHRFAAIASVSGTFSPQMQASCSPSHAIPVMQIHGTNDATVPYPGTASNGGMASVDTVINYWVNYNNCNTTPSVTALPNINTADGSTVEHIVYSGGTAGVNVELLKVINGGHDWPGASGNMDIIASNEIWKFFSRYTNTAVGTKNISALHSLKVYPNPTTDFITIEWNNLKSTKYILYNLIGQEIKKGELTNSNSSINLHDLLPNIYFLQIENSYFKIVKN